MINAGGLISVAMGLRGENPNGAEVWALVCRIGATLAEIFVRAEAEGVSPDLIANQLARERIARRHARIAKVT